MEKQIGDLLPKPTPMTVETLTELIGTLPDECELSELERLQVIYEARKLKLNKIIELEKSERIEENRRFLTSHLMSKNMIDSFMRSRAEKMFGGVFDFDGQVLKVYELFCMYFSKDEGFGETALSMKISNPSLDKGLLLVGAYGVGKTWLMQLFQRNQRQVYRLMNAKGISLKFQELGVPYLESLIHPEKLPVNDTAHWYHKVAGICIDDIGSENEASHYKNQHNVIGDLIEMKYSEKCYGPVLHATSNLSGQKLKDFYGPRVNSRLFEMFNVIYLDGKDLRK